jgi:hypothetical protein
MQDTITWRIVLCTNFGEPISMLDGIARDVTAQFTMNRAGMVTFNVPSDHPLVNEVFSDGLPYLVAGHRAVKAYRKVGEGAGGWDLKFAGRVWSLEDQGDGDSVRTQVTCFDPLKILEKRVVRDHDGAYWRQSRWFYPPTALQAPLLKDSGISGSKIIKELIDRSRKFAGMPPGGSSTGSNMSPVHIETGNYDEWPSETWAETQGFDYQTEPGSYVMPHIIQICNTGTVDLQPRYLDVFDGVFLHLGSTARLGSDKTGSVTLAYAATPFTASTFDRTQSLDDLANYIDLIGKKRTGNYGLAYDTASMDEVTGYLVFEAVENMSDITNKDALQFLADLRLKMQKEPRDMVTVVPTPEASPLPWDDYYLGDTISIRAATTPYPVTRQTVEGAQRVYGIQVTLDNDFGEFVSQLIVSPQDAEA